MRRPTLRQSVAPALVAGALLLTACATGTETTGGASPSASGQASPSGSACPPAPSGSPAPTAVAAAPGSSDPAGVEATGAFGEKPDVTVPAGDPPAELHTTVLAEGDGKVVRACELLVANYLGQTWAPKDGQENVFDNSYDRGSPANFVIGAGKVVPGWDKALVGQKVGSRVLVTIPPADGYGDQQQSEQLPPGSTLVFVVDIVDTFDVTARVPSTPVADLPAGLPTVTEGAAGAAPEVTVPEGAEPTKGATTVVATGTGTPVGTDTTVIANALQVNWTDGKVVGDTYTTGQPLALTLEQAATVPGLEAALKAAAAGTRTVSVLPKDLAGGTAGVLVLEVLGSY